MRTTTLVFIILFLSCINVLAQAKFYANADAKEMLSDSYVNVSFTIENATGNRFRPPIFKNFNVIQGPSQSTSTSIVNGNVSSKQSFGYVLQPKKIGLLTIPSASIMVKGQKIKTKPIKIKVVKSTKKTNSTNSKPYYIKAVLSDSTAYPGQQVILSYILYFKQSSNITSIDINSEDPFDGFYKEDIRDYKNKSQRKIINGEEWIYQTVRQVALFPQTAGIFDITKSQFTLYVSTSRRSSFFNRGKQERLAANALKIEVNELPRNRDPYFCGAIGKYRINTSATNKKNISTDDSYTINMMITGDGDPKMMRPPILRLTDSLEVYDPNLINEDKIVNNGKSIHRTNYEYLIVPKYPGRYKIKPSFTYFEADSNSFVEIFDKSYTIRVSKGNSLTLNKQDAALSRRSDKMASFITDVSVSKKGTVFFNSWLFWILTGLMLLSYPWIILQKRKKIAAGNIDPILLKKQLAEAEATKRLEVAKYFIDQKDQKGFYNEILKCFSQYISDKLQIPLSEISKTNIIAKLKSLEVAEVDVTHTQEILQSCEMALFAGSNQSEKMIQIHTDSLRTLSSIERHLS